jgi:AraC-like DNA-binding protein
MDLVDNLLDGLQLQSSVLCRMDLYGDWGFAKETVQGTPFHVVLLGDAWLRLSDEKSFTRLHAGDLVVLPAGEAHDLMATQNARLVPFKQILAKLGRSWSPGIRLDIAKVCFGEGDAPTTQLISGVFTFGEQRECPLLKALPRVFHLRGDKAAETPAQTWLSPAIASLRAEVESDRPGACAVASRLADIMLVQAVRTHVADRVSVEPTDQGWLRGIGDPQVGRALSMIHAHPDTPWRVATLAEAVGMSRSRFAERFQELVGKTPLDYVTQWRMYLAAGRLSEGRLGMADLARLAGYASEVAFSKAFKRWTGRSPSEYRRRMRLQR